ncbi:MAG: hypothetical protein Edafosvirus2_89 [Edafosvirus sp.]|uniref:MFS transporter n=1 Tax=Edafosvirus sp. TaxID=2487765 RepID=A0A3G4ZSM6_9VIRU|nr:MAG: hypothetical protein Edafosvirus2_89 [Edafosvirus sp.]
MDCFKNNYITAIYLAVISSMTYFCQYFISTSMFAGAFTTNSILGTTKNALVISQSLSYIMGYIIGFFVLTKIDKENIFKYFIITIFGSFIPMLLFLTSSPLLQIIGTYISGIFITNIWGFIIFYVEGRYASSIIVMIIYMLLIIAGGFAKSMGTLMLSNDINENLMTVYCSIIGLVGCLFFAYLLNESPERSADEEKSKSSRKTGNDTATTQMEFIDKYKIGLITNSIAYGFISSYRKYRDYYQLELWTELMGKDFDAGIYSYSDVIISIVVTLIYCLIIYIKSDLISFFVLLVIMMGGSIIIIISTIVYSYQTYKPFVWIVVTGIGVYMAYVPPGVLLYDKLISATKTQISIVPIIFLSEMIAQVVTLITILIKSNVYNNYSYVSYFINISYIFGAIVVLGMIISMYNFRKLQNETHKEIQNSVPESIV